MERVLVSFQIKPLVNKWVHSLKKKCKRIQLLGIRLLRNKLFFLTKVSWKEVIMLL